MANEDSVSITVTASGDELRMLNDLAKSVSMAPEELLSLTMKDVFQNLRKRVAKEIHKVEPQDDVRVTKPEIRKKKNVSLREKTILRSEP